jgi:hypothetical protein
MAVSICTSFTRQSSFAPSNPDLSTDLFADFNGRVWRSSCRDFEAWDSGLNNFIQFGFFVRWV